MKALRRKQIGIAVAVAPLAVLGAGWAGGLPSGEPLAPTATLGAAPRPPETVPPAIERPLEVPASHTEVAAASRTKVVVAARSSSAVPSLALAAYQRAEAVMDSADSTCRISWPLIAAVGDVESDHGRHGGSRLDAQGRAHPAIIGARLDGSGSTAAIADSDAGAYDGDRRWDRAVGPMQFIPSTWSLVGVDADGDSRRDPQDIDDAALAAAVYLCSGPESLATDAGRRVAVRRYNHSDAYVDLVLRLMQAYADGSLRFTMVSAQPFTIRQVSPSMPDQDDAALKEDKPGKGKKGQAKAAVLEPVPGEDPAAGELDPGTTAPSEAPAPEAPAPEAPGPEQPGPEQPGPEQPAPEQPAPEQPAPEQPTTEPAPEQPATEECATEEPATEECATEEPAEPQEPTGCASDTSGEPLEPQQPVECAVETEAKPESETP